MIPKGVLRHAEIPWDINKWKMPTSKFGQFWPKTMDLPLGKKSFFRRNTRIFLKACNRIGASENVPWDPFKASQGTRDKEIAHKRWSQGESWTENSLSEHYLHLKMIPKAVLRHPQIPRVITKWKMPTSKFGHFWPKTMDLPLGKKTTFGRNTTVLLKASNPINVSENLTSETF